MKLSIVTTLYKSAPFIDAFYQRTTAVAASITDDFEIITVDDGSPDESLQIALGIAARDARVTVIELSRNFGHHRAMMTGLEVAGGDFVFLIDSDLEEEPEWLPVFWKKLHEAPADVVYGYQTSRKGSALERLGGALHWWIIRMLSNYPIPENLVTARLMTHQYVRSLVQHKEQKTAIGGLWAITGYKQVGQPVTKGSRSVTSYPLTSRVTMAFEGITSFSEKPLLMVFVVGVGIFVLAAVGAIYLIIRRLTGELLSGWASVMVSLWMLGGLSIASIGILGLYIARIFIETKHRPYSIIRAVHRAGAPASTHDVEARSTHLRTL